MNKLPELKIGNLKVNKAIIQGGMGVGISLSGLASAVAKEGGIGVLSCVGIGMNEPDFKKDFRTANKRASQREIRKVRGETAGVLGVNIMVALSDFDDFFKISLEEKIDVIFMGAGLPLKLPQGITIDDIKNSGTKIVPIVSSGKAAKLIFKTWKKNYSYIPDAVVIEGKEAGGHLGFKLEHLNDDKFSLENIFPSVKEVIQQFEEDFSKKIPIIVGGGIFCGKDIYKMIKMGADGVQMGTRFVATHECDASDEFKNLYVNCKKEDIKIIKSPLGLPGRAINNSFLEDVSNGMKKPFQCPWKCIKHCDFRTAPYCIGKALLNAKSGDIVNGFAFAGSQAYRVEKILSVKELFAELEEDFHE